MNSCKATARSKFFTTLEDQVLFFHAHNHEVQLKTAAGF